MASSRPIGTNENISTYHSAGTGTPDYTSLGTWESATDNDLVTLTTSEVLECFAGTHANSITFLGATTNSSYRRIIRPAAGNFHAGIRATGVIFAPTGAANTITLSEGWVSLQDIGLSPQMNNTGNFYALVFGSTSADCSGIGIIVYNGVNAGSGKARGVLMTGPRASLINSIVENNNGSDVADVWMNNGTGSLLANCTLIAGNAKGVEASIANELTIINVITSGYTTPYTGTFTSSGSKNNASTGTGTPGTDARDSQTFTFVNAPGHDYHLDDGDAGALGFGFDQSGTYDDDLDRETVSVWSIGADSQVAVPTAPDPPTNLAIANVSPEEQQLTWDAPVDDGGSAITGYKIEVESPTGGGFSVLVADTGTTATSYNATGRTPNTQYNYRVSAINAIGTSTPSTAAAATTPQIGNNVYLALMSWLRPYVHNVPVNQATIDQATQQQLLWGVRDPLWAAAVSTPASHRVLSGVGSGVLQGVL